MIISPPRLERRTVLALAGAAAVLPTAGCGSAPMADYDRAARSLRFPAGGAAAFESLVRLAMLAPNGHNTQPWQFVRTAGGVGILPDFSRRTPAVDPDDHHLFVSLGCACENFVLGSGAAGRPAAATFVDDGVPRLAIDSVAGPARADVLYRAITARQSTRSVFDGRPLSPADLRSLADAARMDGVSLLILDDAPRREAVMDFVTHGNSLQMDDDAFLKELKGWIRFNPDEALAMRDGLFSACSGGPSIPSWLGHRFFSLVFRKASENRKYAEQIRSSAGIAVFVGDKATKANWVAVGRSFQRFALQATALGVRCAMVNQPVEVPAVRREFAKWLGIGDARPDLVVRFGRAPAMPMSLRRPARAVILEQD